MPSSSSPPVITDPAAAEEARKTGRTGDEEEEIADDSERGLFLAAEAETEMETETDDAKAVSAIVAAASSGMAFGVAAAPRDPSDFAAHRHVLWLFADDPSRQWWGSAWRDRILESGVAEQSLSMGHATRDELEQISRAWVRWADEPAGWFVIVHGELVCRA